MFGSSVAYQAIVERLNQLSAPLAKYEDAALAIMSAAEAGGDTASKLSAFDTAFRDLEVEMEAAADVIDGTAEAIRMQSEALNAMVGPLMIGVIVAGISFAVALLFLAAQLVSKPILSLSEDMTKIADGDTQIDCSGLGRKDEIGTMAKAVEVFRQGAIDKLRLEREAEETRERAEAERIEMQRKAEDDAAERLRIATSGLAVGLRRLASGDLSVQLTEAFAPDFEALRHDFNQSVRQLGATMAAIAHSISAIDGNAQEITRDVNDLSRRTEQQAASLEETASALEEITANISNSSQRTDEALLVANDANRNASGSAKIVTQADEAMSRIEHSSEQIANIIGVIDEIAFQTNLLALNAGVEAARAGDAGKGFAVVAQEVRELAQRSATAAKEIKDLIQASTDEVETGVGLVRKTADALNKIGEQIAEIDRNMQTISGAAREQSTGIREINTAVNQMDQVTQHNAAMVEEATAATSALAQEAANLRAQISQFKLGEGMGDMAHAA